MHTELAHTAVAQAVSKAIRTHSNVTSFAAPAPRSKGTGGAETTALHGTAVVTLAAVSIAATGSATNEAAQLPWDNDLSPTSAPEGVAQTTPSTVAQRPRPRDLHAPMAGPPSARRTSRDKKRDKTTAPPGGCVYLERYWAESPEYKRLSSKAVRVFQALYLQYSGKNNGDLTFTEAQARDWRVGEQTRATALHELRTAGWIVRTKRGGLNMGPDLYAVTVKPIDRVFDNATRAYKLDIPAGSDYLHLWQDKYADRRVALLDPEMPRTRRKGPSKPVIKKR